jgi:hypothetical protein
VGEAKLMTNIKMENLNVGKFVFVLSIPLTFLYFFLFKPSLPDHPFYLVVILLSSPLAAMLTAWFIGMAMAIIYEILKLCRPFFEWLFK